MNTLILILLMMTSSKAATDQCPTLAGQFFCKGVEGSHKDMEMLITQNELDGVLTYNYLYLQEGEQPLSLSYLASNEGSVNPGQDNMIGVCLEGKYFNSFSGKVEEKTLFNYVNQDGEYIVERAKDSSLFLKCPKFPQTK